MKKLFFMVVVLGSLLPTAPSNAQCLDKVGFSAGYVHSTLNWYNSTTRIGPDKPYLSGLSIMAFAEKSMCRTFAIRSQFGYMTQGYGSSENLRYAAPPSHPRANFEGYRFHQLALDLAAKVNLSHGCLNPYLTAGIRNHYTMTFQELDPYAAMEDYAKLIPTDFNRYTLSATLGIGMEICHAFFIEAEYNPALSNSIRYDPYHGRSSSYGIKAGYFLFNKRQSCSKKGWSKTITPVF